ncbi:SpoIIE family protein phosphatase [Rhodocytophaga rosea]|uniref:SpoIIE family protein phosphatase n=1 Tax=Rhodocytophaga rosea TaxID=2704465 RepID=A0A6C0GTA6_9BACT|nr:SpoIIE family protein phosphatase [Rhodocytophaga rosea]QHT71395.1 SpoIIE family protein phosphatase [Rhodocytophaga rosea]
MAEQVSLNFSADWQEELRQTAQKYHVIGCWVAIVLNPIWVIGDYFTLPAYWKIFFTIRIGVALLTVLALILKKQLRLSAEALIFVPVIGISLQNAYMYSVMGAADIQKHTFAYIALFIGVGMLVLWKPVYSVLMVVLSIVANIIFFALFSQLTLEQILLNGGMLTATVAVFTIILIQTRYSLTIKEIMARMALAQTNTQLLEQKDIIEHKNKSITQSINYAKRIQLAILPSKDLIRQHLPDSFIFYLPKDIVSGDFYWFSHKNGKSVIAAADCTGHGVPGAFMSMIASSLLSETVNEKGITQPGAILDTLRKGVIKALAQSGNPEEAKEGLDIALCSYDQERQTLEYAGAFNPMYFIRQGQVTEIKADKQPIGVYPGKQTTPFTNHSFEILPGDAVYIFTDGFADQFGGPEGKKFRYKPFQELLLSIQSERIATQQEQLQQAFNSWRGETKQIDDVLVIGMRF